MTGVKTCRWLEETWSREPHHVIDSILKGSKQGDALSDYLTHISKLSTVLFSALIGFLLHINSDSGSGTASVLWDKSYEF